MKYRINSPRRMALELTPRQWFARVIGRYRLERKAGGSIIRALRFALPERWRD